MADDASRRWDLSDSDLLTHFATTYPQATSWRLSPLLHDTNSALIGALCRRRLHDGFRSNATTPPTPPGRYGRSSARNFVSTPLHSAATPCDCCSCSPRATEQERSLPAVTLSALARWRTPYARSARRTPGWGPLTLV